MNELEMKKVWESQQSRPFLQRLVVNRARSMRRDAYWVRATVAIVFAASALLLGLEGNYVMSSIVGASTVVFSIRFWTEFRRQTEAGIAALSLFENLKRTEEELDRRVRLFSGYRILLFSALFSMALVVGTLGYQGIEFAINDKPIWSGIRERLLFVVACQSIGLGIVVVCWLTSIKKWNPELIEIRKEVSALQSDTAVR
ncbi:MAG: hypothetical protein AAF483_26440 [Planctomycetota bacterium]